MIDQAERMIATLSGNFADKPEQLALVVSDMLRTCVLAQENNTSGVFARSNGVATTLTVIEALAEHLSNRIEAEDELFASKAAEARIQGHANALGLPQPEIIIAPDGSPSKAVKEYCALHNLTLDWALLGEGQMHRNEQPEPIPA